MVDSLPLTLTSSSLPSSGRWISTRSMSLSSVPSDSCTTRTRHLSLTPPTTFTTLRALPATVPEALSPHRPHWDLPDLISCSPPSWSPHTPPPHLRLSATLVASTWTWGLLLSPGIAFAAMTRTSTVPGASHLILSLLVRHNPSLVWPQGSQLSPARPVLASTLPDRLTVRSVVTNTHTTHSHTSHIQVTPPQASARCSATTVVLGNVWVETLITLIEMRSQWLWTP